MNDNVPETTSGGVVGKVVGTAKEKLGSATGNDDLAREGRLQQAAVDAENEADLEEREAEISERTAEVEANRLDVEAERRRLAVELEADEREAAIEAEKARAEAQIDAATADELRQAELERAA